MQESVTPDEDANWTLFLGFAGRLIYEGIDRPSFLDKIRKAGPALTPDLLAGGRMRPEDAQRMAGALGFAIWRAMPHPHHGWRAMPAPLPGRNEPCYCGSGQKFKRCCATVPLPGKLFEDVNLLRYLLEAIPASRFNEIPHSRLDPLALADTAQQWLAEGDVKRAAKLLEPLFGAPERLDARHAEAFDTLMAAWLALDRPRKRTALVESLMEHPDTEIATTARQRKVTMLADRGDWDDAWSLFQSSLRRTPDHPHFAHLEITMLMSQGREDEARSRAQFWAQRLRKIDPYHADYAETIVELASDPSHVLLAANAGSPLISLWHALLDAAPAPDAPHAVATDASLITLEPSRELAKVESRWRRRFPVQKPIITLLESSPEEVLENVPAVAEFLKQHPLAWQSFEVLDDLALAAHWMTKTESVPPPWLSLQRRLAERAEALLGALLPQRLAPPGLANEEPALVEQRLMADKDQGGDYPTLPWSVPANRAALRLVVLQIDARMSLRPGDPRTPALMAWLLRLNPDDNHGYRELLAQRWLRESRAEAALALMDRYPDDIGTALADRILALYILGRLDEAAARWTTDGARLVEIRRALLARSYRRPRKAIGGFIEIGGRDEAWLYREEMRPLWERSGALRWLAAQPAHSVRAGAPPAHAAEPGAPHQATQDERATTVAAGRRGTVEVAAGPERFSQAGGDPVRAHGVMVANALAPDMTSPAGWVSLLIMPSDGAGPAFTGLDDVNRVLGGLTAWYNAILGEIGPAANGGPRLGALAIPWLDERTSDAVSRWAAGFIACVGAEPAAWRRLGSVSQPLFAPLRQLAARAPLSAAEKSNPERVRDRVDDDAPLLALVDDSDPVELLEHALARLVEAVGRVRSQPGPRPR